MKKENGFIEIFALVIITTLILGIGIYMYNSSASNIGDATNN